LKTCPGGHRNVGSGIRLRGQDQLEIKLVTTASAKGCQKLGPVRCRLSNLALELNKGTGNRHRTKVPLRFSLSSGLLNGASVPRAGHGKGRRTEPFVSRPASTELPIGVIRPLKGRLGARRRATAKHRRQGRSEQTAAIDRAQTQPARTEAARPEPRKTASRFQAIRFRCLQALRALLNMEPPLLPDRAARASVSGPWDSQPGADQPGENGNKPSAAYRVTRQHRPGPGQQGPETQEAKPAGPGVDCEVVHIGWFDHR